MDATRVYDVIVVGAGVVGSATARHLVTTGTKNVLLLEQVRLNTSQSFVGKRIPRVVVNCCDSIVRCTLQALTPSILA